MRAHMLRSGTRVPNSPSQLRKFSQRIPKCCGMVWQQNAHFAEVLFRLRNLIELCFCSVFTLFLLRFRSDFFSFQFPWNFFHLGSFKKIKTHLKTWFKIKSMETTWKFTKFTKILDCGKPRPANPSLLKLFEAQGGWFPPFLVWDDIH